MFVDRFSPGTLNIADGGPCRAACGAVTQSKATLQQLMATSLLHVGGYDDAADVIEQILAEDPYPHLAELYKRLYNMLDAGLAFEQQRWRTSPDSARLSQINTEIKTSIARSSESDDRSTEYRHRRRPRSLCSLD